MTLLFGQFPQRAIVTGQLVIHSYVGSIGDPVEPPIDDIPRDSGSPAHYVRRTSIGKAIKLTDEEAIAMLGVLKILIDEE